MTNNTQQWFDNEFSEKGIDKIKIEYETLTSSLTIEDYPNLKQINLADNILEKDQRFTHLELKNLPSLEKVRIYNCDLEKLIIENCPKIKILSVPRNSLKELDSLNFKYLLYLKELEIDNNLQISSIPMEFGYLTSLKKFSYEKTGLVENLKSYQDGWKGYKAHLQIDDLSYLLNFLRSTSDQNTDNQIEVPPK